MKNKKNLGKIIALALALGSCTCNVTEAYQDSIYGNSPSSDFTVRPTDEGVDVSGYVLDFDFHNIDNAFGGYAINANALSNVLNFNSGDAGSVYAGYVDGHGNAIGNKLQFSNGTTMFLYGGCVDWFIDVNGVATGNGNANNNSIEVNGGHISHYTFGGCTGNGDANNNCVTINGGRFSDRVIGGEARNGSANNNVVNIRADMNNSGVGGGFARDGNSNNNTVNIMTGADNIYWVSGGDAYKKSDDSTTVREYTSNSNKVVIDTGANIGQVIGGEVANIDIGYRTSASDNEIIVNNGNISNSLIASHTVIDSSKANDDSYIKASNNSVTFNGGNALSIAAVGIVDDNNGSSDVNKKTKVIISGNNLTMKGGEVGIACVIADNNVVPSALTVKDNSIDIKGGVVQTNVYGGHFVIDNLSTIEAANNTVNWYDGDVNGSINGYTYTVLSGGQFSNYGRLKDSTFNFFASISNSNKRISNLDGFENYHFYLDNTVPANTTLINLTGYADLSRSNIGVAVLGSSPLQQGDSVTLLDATNSAGSIMTSSNLSNNTSHMTAENISTVYDFTLENQDNKKLIATVSGSGSNHKSENLMAVRSAEAFMTYDKVDVVDKAYQASKHTSEPTSFIEYGYSDVTTKDDTKLRGSNVLWGIASTIGGEKDQANTLTRGLFFEYGDGTFSSIGHYPTGSIYGYGKSKKLGLGVLLRKVMFDRHYYDAYLRAGTIKTDYDAFADGVGNITYENSDMYVSGNLGYGQFIQLTPNLQMDTYIKYFYNRIPGHSTTAYTNGVEAMPISFDVFENHRFRLGSKFTWDYMESNNYKWYADVALEQEFARDQSGSINSHRISKSNGSSTTGIIELCYENKFGVNDAFMFTAKAQGYVGDRRGLGASANLSFSF